MIAIYFRPFYFEPSDLPMALAVIVVPIALYALAMLLVHRATARRIISALFAVRMVIIPFSVICSACANCDPWWLMVFGICVPR